MAFDSNKPAVDSALSSADMRNNFQHLKNAIAKEHHWNDGDAGASSHRLDAMSVGVSGSLQGNVTSGGSIGEVSNSAGSVPVLNQVAGISGGQYTLQTVLQELVNRSHAHGAANITYNCNCNCDCGDDSGGNA